MYALDATTGKVVWKADEVVDRNRGYSSTGAPEVAGDVVVIGNGGAEYDVRGYVTAFDLETGRLNWRFWIVPRDPKLGAQDHPDLEQAAKTWDPNSRWDVGGGGAPWDAINYDAETGLVIVGTGNGGPYDTNKRSPAGGDQLYLGSIVAQGKGCSSPAAACCAIRINIARSHPTCAACSPACMRRSATSCCGASSFPTACRVGTIT